MVLSQGAAVGTLGMCWGTKMLSLSVYSHLNALLSQLSPQLVKVMLDTVGRCYFLCYTHTRTFYRSLLLPKPCLTEGMCSSILQQAGKNGNFLFSCNWWAKRVYEKDGGRYLFGLSFFSMTLEDTCQPWDLYMKFITLSFVQDKSWHQLKSFTSEYQ